MALVMPLLLTVFLGVFEFGHFYYTRLTLQHAVREATRFAVTGNVLTDSIGDPLDRATSIVNVILHNTRNLDVALDGVSITPADGGGPEDIVRVSVDFRYELTMPLVKDMMPNSHVDISFATAMRNESFYE